MLRNILEDYINNIKEREFDIPFLCILLKEGYYDIHFLHGKVEFGKDFIAKIKKGDKIIQCAFQSKAGNINQQDFREIRLQCDEMRKTILSHSNYDTTLERECFLVLTGRLKGNATLLSQDYDRQCKEQGEVGLTVWDCDSLIEKMLNEELGYIGITGRRGNEILINNISKIKEKEFNNSEIEVLYSYWCDSCDILDTKSCFGIILESCILTQELIRNNNYYLACSISLLPLIPLLYSIKKQGAQKNILYYKKTYFKKIFEIYKSIMIELINDIDKYDESSEGIYKNSHYSNANIVTHSVNCSKIVENIALFGFIILEEDYSRAKEIGNILVNLFKNNAATCHPISDKYAYSLMISIIFLYKLGYKSECENIIKKVAIWILERYEKSELGLAGVTSKSGEEIERLLGYAFKFIKMENRRESYIVTVLLDLSYILGYYKLYEDILNDVIALDVRPCIVLTEDNEFQFVKSDKQVVYENLAYLSNIDVENKDFKIAVNHDNNKYFAELNNLVIEELAVLSNLRDRHRVSLIKSVINH